MEYSIIIHPVTRNISAVQKLLLKVLGPGQEKKAKVLTKKGGIVLENLNKKAADNFANQLRELGAQVEIVEMKETDSGDANPSFEVRFIDAGKNEAKVIKVIRELTKFSLKEAKSIVDRLGVVVENISKKEGEKVKAKLEAAGARAHIEEMPSPEPEPDEPELDFEDCNTVYGNLTDKNGQHLAKFSINICDATIQKWLSLVDRFTDKETSDFMSHKRKAKKKHTNY